MIEKRGSILIEASDVINGERQDQYGNPEDSFKGIAERWEKYLRSKYKKCLSGKSNELGITAADVAHMMIEFKLERECNNPKRDNLRDACGYAAIKADILKKETE